MIITPRRSQLFVTLAIALLNMQNNTFGLFQDVIRLFEAYLRGHDIIDGGLQSKRSLQAAQNFFNQMQQQSGLSLQQISQTLSYSCGDNVVGMANT